MPSPLNTDTNLLATAAAVLAWIEAQEAQHQGEQPQ
jgi:hypothetical protein